MAPTRVLRIIARMNVGGPALQVVALTRGLNPPRFDTRLLVGRVATGEADYLDLRAPDTPAEIVRGLGRTVSPADDVTALMTIIGHIRRFRPHIVHTHTAKAGVLGRVAAQVCKVPVTVHTFHGHLLNGYFSAPVRRMVVECEKTLARRTSCLVAVGSQVRDDLVAAGIGTMAQYRIVPPGLDLPSPPSKEAARQRFDVPLDALVVAYVARMTPIKRPDRFADVALSLGGRLPQVHFLVSGEGELLDRTRGALAPLGARAHLVGWRSDVEVIYAAADVVVLTSDNEGMPVSLIEAATVGTPAVTTDVGSASEVVVHGETGYVTGRDVTSIVEALERILLDDAGRQRMSGRATDRAREGFSSTRLVDDMAQIYDELTSGLPKHQIGTARQ